MIKKCEKNYYLTDLEKRNHELLINFCMDCKNDFSINCKVVHHDHITGNYISTLCSKCNLNYQYKKFIPVFAHNLKNYDAHFLVPALHKYGYQNHNEDVISAIPSNEEKYISFSKKISMKQYQIKDKKTGKMQTKHIFMEIRFLDTFSFMASSLGSLVENLKKSCQNDIYSLRKTFKYTSENFTNDNDF